MCSRVTCFLVKEIEYNSLVNGTWLQERVKAIFSHSDYRLQADKSYYFVVSNKGELTTKNVFEYNAELDSKKDNQDLFSDNHVSNYPEKGGNFGENKSD